MTRILRRSIMADVGPLLPTRLRRAAALALLLLVGACRGPLPEPIRLVLPRADNGRPFSFADRRGETTLVFFFATWCVPCQAMEASVAEVVRRGAKEGIEVIGVALDIEGRRTVAPYVWATKPPYPVVVGGGEVARGASPFGKIPELPALLFLDRDGRPAASMTGFTGPDALLHRAREVMAR